MIARYVQDIRRMVNEIARVLKVGARATFVMGNSCLRDVSYGTPLQSRPQPNCRTYARQRDRAPIAGP